MNRIVQYVHKEWTALFGSRAELVQLLREEDERAELTPDSQEKRQLN